MNKKKGDRAESAGRDFCGIFTQIHYLQFPVDSLKIDRSFISGVANLDHSSGPQYGGLGVGDQHFGSMTAP
jgi:hypothetical protein